ncbi:hypothetical protein TB2_003502 [Malus domestica]
MSSPKDPSFSKLSIIAFPTYCIWCVHPEQVHIHASTAFCRTLSPDPPNTLLSCHRRPLMFPKTIVLLHIFISTIHFAAAVPLLFFTRLRPPFFPNPMLCPPHSSPSPIDTEHRVAATTNDVEILDIEA